MWRPDDPQGNEAAKIAPLIAPYTRGMGVDVGCGTYKPYDHFIGIDNGEQWGRRVAPVHAEGETIPFADDSLDFVFSSHFLEHVADFKATLADWWRAIKPGGHLVLYLPHKMLYPNIGQPGANPDHEHDYLPVDILEAMRSIKPAHICLEDETRSDGEEYSFYQVFQKRARDAKQSIYEPWTARRADEPPRCLVVRYGGVGDMLMASAILPALKAQGYEITFNTTPDGQNILSEDPNIDHWIIQDRDQVPNERLHIQHYALGKRYDRVVNLCEAVEGSLLPMPRTVNHGYPDDVRRDLYGGVNYIDRHREIAGIPPTVPCIPMFHPTTDEAKWAKAQLAQIRKLGGQVIAWALSGSSVHKVYPWTDNVIAAVMLEDPDSVVVLLGDDLCEMLELGWENEPRVIKTCGTWNIRQSLAFAQLADIVVGPETGIMQAVAYTLIRKICMLSHSSVANLTRDWPNTTSIEPEVACYPCHRMQYGFTEFCPRDEASGGVVCATSIPHELVRAAILTQAHAQAAE